MLKQISLASLQGSLISKYSQLRETKERATTNKLRSLRATSHHPVYNQHSAIQGTHLKKETILLTHIAESDKVLL